MRMTGDAKMLNPFNAFTTRFWILFFFILCFLAGFGVSRILPQERWIPEKDTKEKPFCNPNQSWMWDERQKGYWNQAYCHYKLLRQKDGFPRLFTAEEISEGVIIKSKY
jgi:hypothetical protein